MLSANTSWTDNSTHFVIELLNLFFATEESQLLLLYIDGGDNIFIFKFGQNRKKLVEYVDPQVATDQTHQAVSVDLRFLRPVTGYSVNIRESEYRVPFCEDLQQNLVSDLAVTAAVIVPLFKTIDSGTSSFSDAISTFSRNF